MVASLTAQWVEEPGVEEMSGYAPPEAPTSRLGRLGAAAAPGGEDVAAVTPSVATATMAPFPTDLDDVFISVKTTRHYHHSRLPAIIGTWFQFAREQVSPNFFLTDLCWLLF